LIWKYKNGLGERVERNNQQIFMSAVDMMCRAMQCFIQRDTTMNLESMPGIPAKDAKIILSLIKSIKGNSGEVRHQKWIDEIGKGRFSFGAEKISYTGKGKGSWKHKSIGQLAAADSGREIFPYKAAFMKSDWKHFHDALQAHRLDVLHDVLPRYGICAA
jgi:hypothetical protein